MEKKKNMLPPSFKDAKNARATALVSMNKADKEKLTTTAKAHGLSLSAFFRLAADEYIKNHGWEVEGRW